ncbi:TIGR04219 family outer membrane beta-barrel protein [Nautilia sp.]
MKKLLSIALITAGLAGVASADLLSLSAGAGYEQQDISGYVKLNNTVNYFNNASAETDGNNNTGNFGLSDEKNPYVWVKFIHPVPIIPNIKLQYTKYDSSGKSNYVSGNVKIFGDVSIPTALTNVVTSQTINSYDLTFFYEFKPVVADIEAGFGLDYWQGNTKISGDNAVLVGSTVTSTGTKTNIDEDWSVILPYLYAHVETMKIFGVSFIGDVKWAKAGDNHHYDYQGAVKYTIDIPGPVNPFIKAGYRYKEAYGVDGNNETLLKYKGAFIEIGAKF